jgi:hypothetical protein
MKPKEKAEQLVNTYKVANYPKLNKDECKKCALIAVDEILLACALETKGKFEYYFEVKKEIEKL